MKTIQLGSSELYVPQIGIGCMRLAGLSKEELIEHIRFCVDHGLNFFDHADIYGGGACEEAFGKALKESGIKREQVILQSKCGIVPGQMYNFDKDYILESVDGILNRLQTDYLDVLVLHRPDALMEPEVVAEAFDELEKSGKVKHFGVSNFRPMQIELLQKYVRQPLLVDQMQFSIPFSSMISQSLEANMPTEGAIDRDGGILDYTRLHNMTLQTWSPFQYGNWQGVFVENKEAFPKLSETMEELAEKYNVTPTGIAAAWILRHPAKMQLIAGTTKTERLEQILAGAAIDLSRQDWYRLYLDAGHILP
jgi:predicted oxidoreductase